MSSSVISTCNGCGNFCKLVKSHIVPESFAVLFNRPRRAALIIDTEHHPRKSQRGIYDFILCDTCEQALSIPDDYAQKMLIQRASEFTPIFDGNELVAEKLADYDYKLLHRFAISVLWRASISSHDFYNSVNLGPHQERLKSFSLGHTELPDDQYSMVVGKLIYKSTGNMASAPIRKKWLGTNYWTVYVGDWHFWIKVDTSRSTPPFFKTIEAKPNSPLIVLCRDLLGSPEHRAAKLIAKKWKQRVNRPTQ